MEALGDFPSPGGLPPLHPRETSLAVGRDGNPLRSLMPWIFLEAHEPVGLQLANGTLDGLPCDRARGGEIRDRLRPLCEKGTKDRNLGVREIARAGQRTAGRRHMPMKQGGFDQKLFHRFRDLRTVIGVGAYSLGGAGRSG